MKLLTLLILIFLGAGPLEARELRDLHLDIESVFPGKIEGVSGAPGDVRRIDFSHAATATDKSSIQIFVDTYDWNKKTVRDLNQDIDKKISEYAERKDLTDAQFSTIRAKLVRAKSIASESEKEQKFSEGKALANDT